MNHDHFFKKLENESSLVNEISSLGWAFWPNEQTAKGGYFDEISLRILADEIERRNKPFWDEYEKYCAEQYQHGCPGFEEDFRDFESVSEQPK